MRAESCVIVSSTWPAKNIRAVSMIANRSAKNTGATSANSSAADARRLRRNCRSSLRIEPVEEAGACMGSSGLERQIILSKGLAETRWESVSYDTDSMDGRFNVSLTMLAGPARDQRRRSYQNASRPADHRRSPD